MQYTRIVLNEPHASIEGPIMAVGRENSHMDLCLEDSIH